MTVIHLGRCRRNFYIPATNVLQLFSSARHGYSPPAAGSSQGLSSPVMNQPWKPYQFAPLNNWETMDAFSVILTLADFRLSASPQDQPTRFVVPSGDSSHGGWLEVPLCLKAKVRERNHD